MAILEYECRKGHRFEKEGGKDRVKCPKCRGISEILWMAPRSPHRQLVTPIVMFQYADGSLGVAGGADSKTPRDAERVEIRSIGEYRKYANQINSQYREIEEKRENAYLEAKESWERERRSNLAWAMGQESDPVARDLYREALERKSEGGSPSFREFFSTVMEMDRSNYE